MGYDVLDSRDFVEAYVALAEVMGQFEHYVHRSFIETEIWWDNSHDRLSCLLVSACDDFMCKLSSLFGVMEMYLKAGPFFRDKLYSTIINRFMELMNWIEYTVEDAETEEE